MTGKAKMNSRVFYELRDEAIKNGYPQKYAEEAAKIALSTEPLFIRQGPAEEGE